MFRDVRDGDSISSAIFCGRVEFWLLLLHCPGKDIRCSFLLPFSRLRGQLPSLAEISSPVPFL